MDYPSLPMDTEQSTVNIVTLDAETRPEGHGLVDAFALGLGYSDVDHFMSNRNKPNRNVLEAETPSQAASFAARAGSGWRLGDRAHLEAGLDLERLEREATRQRTIVASGTTFFDHIWPDVQRDLVGGFAEVTHDASAVLSLRLGGRIDHAESDARAANDKIVLGAGSPPSTIREQYVRFYGPDAAETDRNATLWSANLVAEWRAAPDVATYAGIGRISRYPSVTEQYFAFAPAPGGFQVGNPALDPEDKYELSGGVRVSQDRYAAELGLFYCEVKDYIYQTSLAQIDVNGDGTVDRVRGFENVEAELYGGELAGTFTLMQGLSMPVSLAYVRARNATYNRDLPEIPPFGGAAALRYEAEMRFPWWCEAGLRFADRQDRIDPTFPEDETPSWQTWHLRGGVELYDGVRLEAGVENLFDEVYHEHLTREALMNAGDLKAGDEVPVPGRYFLVSLRADF